MSEERYVFGISVDPVRDKPFAFVRVDALVQDRRLRTDFNLREEFPTEGKIWVAEENLPDTDLGVIWRVRREAPRSGTRHAEWSAVGRWMTGPLEVISIPISSAHTHAVRQQLLEGVDLGYVPASQVLIRLQDGIVIGPTKSSNYDEDGTLGIRCTSDAFAEPLRAWDSTQLKTFHVEAAYAVDPRHRRTFVYDLELPNTQRWLDLAEFGDVAKSVLRPLATGEGRILTAVQLRGLTLALRDDAFPEKLRARVTRVRQAVQSLAITREELDGLMPAVLAQAEVAAEIDTARRRIEEQARKRIEEEKHGVLEEIRHLKEQEQQLGDRVARLAHDARTAEEAVLAAGDTAASEVRERIVEAMRDAGTLLAQVAVLRPFLAPERESEASESPERRHLPPVHVRSVRVPADSVESDEDAPRTASDMVNRLAADLKAGGLSTNTARILARDVVAALLAGQSPTLTGSFAATLASVLARSLAGRHATIAEIPLGLVSDGPLRDAIDRVASNNTNGAQGVMLLHGLDRSAVEIFGGVLHDTIAERVLARDFGSVPLAFLGSTCGGPACLPVGPGLFDLGPVIDTDLLGYSKKGGSQAPLRPVVPIERWAQWREDLTALNQEAISSTRSACNELSLAGSVLWRKGAETASAFLTALAVDVDEIGVSMLARWVIPRALAEGFSPDDIAPRLEALGFGKHVIHISEGTDTPIAALLERARRTLRAGV